MSTIKQSRDDVMAEKCSANEKKKEAMRKIEESENVKCFLWDIVAWFEKDNLQTAKNYFDSVFWHQSHFLDNI